MGRKEIEAYHLQQLLRVLDLPLHSEPDPGESPDFLLNVAGKTIGVEHTQFFLAPKPGQPPDQMLDSLADSAVDHARRSFRERGGPPLYVWPLFSSRPRTKAEALHVGECLADAVMTNGWATCVRSGAQRFDVYSQVPGIASYHVLPSIDGVEELWAGGGGGIVTDVEPRHVQECIGRKDVLYESYLRKAPEVWLLIVNDMLAGALGRLAPEAREVHYRTNFDRVYWLELIEQEVVRLT